jgi:hypothetical protein
MVTYGTVTRASSLACQDPLFVCGMVTIPQLSIDRELAVMRISQNAC